MRRKLKLGLVLLFLSVAGLLGYQFYKTFEKKQTQLRQMETLPEFTLQDLQGNQVTQNDINKDYWTVFVFFNTECHFCQEEAQQLNAVKESTKEINFLWVSSENIESMVDFRREYQLSDRPNIKFLHDSNGTLTNLWNIGSTPQFLVYDSKGKLAKNHKGAWRIDNLLENIANEFKKP